MIKKTHILDDKAMKRSQLMYIFEAALEYLISILVSGSFLATITKELGIPDSLTGILSSIVSLGCLFQLSSMLYRKARVKRLVVTISIINQLLFMALYVIPLLGGHKPVKITAFVIAIVSAYALYYFVHPKKISWLMSLVDDKKRGVFTANKERFSLLTGIGFSFGMGALIDYFSEQGQLRIAFAICAVVISVLMVLHTLTMLFAVEKEPQTTEEHSFRDSLKQLLRNKKILSVTAVFTLYYVSNYISIPYYGTYLNGELGLSLKYISAIGICGNIVYILIAQLWGRYADKTSFASMVEKGFLVVALSQLCVVFANPETGKVMFLLYYIFNAIGVAGVNSALINMVFDYAPPEQRADSLAVVQAIIGLAGFLATLCVSPLVAYIQANGNVFLGIPIYAQQLITIPSVIISVIGSLFVRFVFRKKTER